MIHAAGAALKRALDVFPVVVVTGARQAGKSTLVRNAPELTDRPYLTLDEPELRDQARPTRHPSWTAPVRISEIFDARRRCVWALW